MPDVVYTVPWPVADDGKVHLDPNLMLVGRALCGAASKRLATVEELEQRAICPECRERDEGV